MHPAWEEDFLTGSNDTHLATLIERHARFVMLVKRAKTWQQSPLPCRAYPQSPEELRRALTWDRGAEMYAHKAFTVATDVQAYFSAPPRSPWQRGGNEHTHGLLRQYVPRGTDFSRISQRSLNAIACGSINVRERPWASNRAPIHYKRCRTDRLSQQVQSRRRDEWTGSLPFVFDPIAEEWWHFDAFPVPEVKAKYKIVE